MSIKISRFVYFYARKADFKVKTQGKSLGGIVDALKAENIPSPTGKPSWTRAAIDKILSNGKYIPIISEDMFWKGQIEIERRTICR